LKAKYLRFDDTPRKSQIKNAHECEWNLQIEHIVQHWKAWKADESALRQEELRTGSEPT